MVNSEYQYLRIFLVFEENENKIGLKKYIFYWKVKEENILSMKVVKRMNAKESGFVRVQGLKFDWRASYLS